MIRFPFAAFGCLFFLIACETGSDESRSRWHDPLGTQRVMNEALHELPYAPPVSCPEPDWQHLVFVESIVSGLCRHPESHAAYAEIEKQAANWGEAQGSYLPTLSLNYRKERDRRKTAFRGEIPASHLRQNPGRATAELQWVLFDFGARNARSQQNLNQVKLATATYSQQLQQRYRIIATHFIDLNIEQQRMVIAKQNMEVAENSWKSAQALHDEGLAIAADAGQAQVEYDGARLQFLQAERDRDNAAEALAESMGYPANTPLNIAELPESISAQAFADIEQLVNETMDSHPDIKAAKARLEATKASLQAVKRSGAPQVFLYANTQHNDRLRTGNHLSYREQENVIGIGVRWPLFEGYTRHYQEKELLAQQAQEEATLEALQSRLSLEVRQAYRQLKTAAEKRTIARNSVEAAELNYQTRLGQYRSGVGGLTDLLQAQRSLNTMRIALADANREWHQAALQLLFSIGKAFPEE